MKENIKTGLIVFLIILIGLFGFIGGKKVSKFQTEIKSLKYENTALATQKALSDQKAEYQEKKNEQQQKKIDSCMLVFGRKDKIISGLTGQLNDALSQLNGITSDSSYIFLKTIAYNYPGLLSYIFNENQIKYIHADYLRARNAEQVIPVYEAQINNCKMIFAEKDTLAAGLRKTIGYQKESLSACEQMNANKDTIIKDTEKERNRERGRKNFWRLVSSMEAGGVIALILLAL